MKKYTLNKVDINNIKYFSIEIGLLPGYTKGTEHTLTDVIDIYKNWLKYRLENSLITIPIKITLANFVYGFNSNKKNIIINENAVSINGEIIREYCPNIFNDNNKLFEIIIEIATIIGQKLEQERVHIIFNNQKYILK